MLYEEHEIIVNAIDTARQAKSLIGKDDMRYEKTIRQLLLFFRNYADGFHHFKEEEILFPEMCKKNVLLCDGVIHEMLDNHREFRERIKKIENFLDEKLFQKAQKILEEYTEALLDHIAVENEEVFQAAESVFSDAELEKMFFRFEDCDRDLGISGKQELKEMADLLRKNLLTEV